LDRKRGGAHCWSECGGEKNPFLTPVWNLSPAVQPTQPVTILTVLFNIISDSMRCSNISHVRDFREVLLPKSISTLSSL
jgi:hypothetical protein